MGLKRKKIKTNVKTCWNLTYQILKSREGYETDILVHNQKILKLLYIWLKMIGKLVLF